jgi:Zn-dependent alcohol dehydrogenase
MADMMKAAVFEKPGVIKVKEVSVPDIGENEVLIKIKYTGSAEQTGASTTAGIPLTDYR